jgi:hypothetical protein
MSSKYTNTNSNYSEVQLLKNKFLVPILKSYNEFIINKENDLENCVDEQKKYMIINNNVKYYLFVINKSCVNAYSSKNSQNTILYFFPDTSCNNTNILEKNFITDFYVEIDTVKTNFTSKNYLFEGYLYKKDNKCNYLLTDILAIDSKIITCNYSLRYAMLDNIIDQSKLVDLNGYLNIDIHSMLPYEDEESIMTNETKHLYKIFINNFMFKESINSIEIIKEKSIKKYIKSKIINDEINQEILKKIKKGKYIDVYDVSNIENNNNEGLLYIKTLSDSRKMLELLKQTDSIEIKCKWNEHFQKWQPI